MSGCRSRFASCWPIWPRWTCCSRNTSSSRRSGSSCPPISTRHLQARLTPWASPAFVESGCCCCRRSRVQPKVVHGFFARARARRVGRVAGGVVGLELEGGAHPQRRVQPGRVVDAFDELEDRRAKLGAGGPASLRGVV